MQASDDPRRRRSLRRHGFNYATAATYLVTICTQGKRCLFGRVVHGHVHLSPAGLAVLRLWDRIPREFPDVHLGDRVLMPNHLHGLIQLLPPPGSGGGVADVPLGRVIGAFKSRSTVAYVRGVKSKDWEPFDGKLWQRNYFDRIVRDEDEEMYARHYIRMNPARWRRDAYHP